MRLGVDKLRERGYTIDNEGAAGRRLAPAMELQSNRLAWRQGGYFCLLAVMKGPSPGWGAAFLFVRLARRRTRAGRRGKSRSCVLGRGAVG